VIVPARRAAGCPLIEWRLGATKRRNRGVNGNDLPRWRPPALRTFRRADATHRKPLELRRASA